MPSGIRIKRIEDRIQQGLAELLLHEVNDPRLKQVFVTDVKVDRELVFANVYVSAVEGSARSAEILAGLESAAGFLRKIMASKVELRAFPKLKFHWDPTPENADHIEKLLAGLREKK
jgi:ribosome-binding factor A